MIHKYPRTRHLAGSRLQHGDDDLTTISFDEIRRHPLTIEEKMDGANCALSFDYTFALRLQSRGHFLTGGPRERHFGLFKQWAATHEAAFLDVLENRYIMYGEWMYAKHTVFYDALPHFFLEFDVLDTHTNTFLDTARRHALLKPLPVTSVLVLHTGICHTTKDLTTLLGPSHFKTPNCNEVLRTTAEKLQLDASTILAQTDLSPLMEGLYIKLEVDGIVKQRLKFVRPDFTSRIVEADSHWLERPIVPNQLIPGTQLFSGAAS